MSIQWLGREYWKGQASQPRPAIHKMEGAGTRLTNPLLACSSWRIPRTSPKSSGPLVGLHFQWLHPVPKACSRISKLLSGQKSLAHSFEKLLLGDLRSQSLSENILWKFQCQCKPWYHHESLSASHSWSMNAWRCAAVGKQPLASPGHLLCMSPSTSDSSPAKCALHTERQWHKSPWSCGVGAALLAASCH